MSEQGTRSPKQEDLADRERLAGLFSRLYRALTRSGFRGYDPYDLLASRLPLGLLSKADSAMYHSKELGRNTFAYFTDTLNRHMARRLALEEQLHGALERQEFHLVYQPKIALQSGELVGAEALIRWHSEALGEVPPAEFIPIAEQCGLILPIGRFVLTQALETAGHWQRQYQRPLCMAVNLSPRQFRDVDLVACIDNALRQSAIDAHSVELEITEGVLMEGLESVETTLGELQKRGLRLVMDDFGTGYSSLSYLRTYPFDVLKIDRSFVGDITRDSADLELVNAAIAMGHGLGLEVVAEGVETQEQLRLLKRQQCDFAQGFLFSRPVGAERFEALLEGGLPMVEKA